MTLPDLLLYTQLLFLAAQFTAGGLDIWCLGRAYKVLDLGTLRADVTSVEVTAILAEHDKWMARHKLAKRWMWAMLACVWVMLPLIFIARG